MWDSETDNQFKVKSANQDSGTAADEPTSLYDEQLFAVCFNLLVTFSTTGKNATELEINTNYFFIGVIWPLFLLKEKEKKTGRNIYFIIYENHFTVLFLSTDILVWSQ